ncbi:MAG: hypothetical protein ACR2MM_09335 [Flavobacteriaceae bacterium]
MKQPIVKIFVLSVCFALFAPIITRGQCDIFKSEITGVKQYAESMLSIVDQVQLHAESAAFAASFNEARSQARKAKIFAGEVLGSAYEAVNLAAEAQHYSGSCGKDDVKSYAIDAERFAVDARDYADEAYSNAKKASGARNLGDVRYFMRKSLDAAKEAQKSADSAVYAASDAYYSCDHQTVSAGGN